MFQASMAKILQISMQNQANLSEIILKLGWFWLELELFNYGSTWYRVDVQNCPVLVGS